MKIIGITDYNSYLNYRKAEKAWTIESKMEIDAIRTNHTRILDELSKTTRGGRRMTEIASIRTRRKIDYYQS